MNVFARRPRTRLPTLALLAPLLASTACSRTDPSRANELSFLHVELLSDIAASPEAPNAFSASPIPVNLRVQALDRDADPLAVDIELTVRVRPGKVGETANPTRRTTLAVPMVGGTWEGEVSIRTGFGPTRIWFSDEDAQGGSRNPTWATGVSDAIHFQLPTLVELQTTNDHETNPLEHEFAEIRTADRNVIVTYVGTNGIYVTDLDSPPGNYNGLYIYTFSKPTTGIEVGSRLSLLTGIDQEYLAATQLSIPVYPTDGGPLHEAPGPVTLDSAQICSGSSSNPDFMEKYEGSLIRVENVTIPSDFQGDSCDEADPTSDFGRFCEYGQWPIQVGTCLLYVVSSVDADVFHAPDHAGETLPYVQGMLSAYWAQSLIQLRSITDIGVDPTAVTTLPQGRKFVPRKNIFHR